MRPNCALCADVKDSSASRCASLNGAPANRRPELMLRLAPAANVRSPTLFAASTARRRRSRLDRTCFIQGAIQTAKTA